MHVVVPMKTRHWAHPHFAHTTSVHGVNSLLCEQHTTKGLSCLTGACLKHSVGPHVTSRHIRRTTLLGESASANQTVDQLHEELVLRLLGGRMHLCMEEEGLHTRQLQKVKEPPAGTR